MVTSLRDVEVTIRVVTNKGEETMRYSLLEDEDVEEFINRISEEIRSMTEVN